MHGAVNDWGLWIILTCPIYLALTGNLKGHASRAAFLAYAWAIAGLLLVNAWHFQQQWVALVRPEQGIDTSPSPDVAAAHGRVLRLVVAEAVVMLVLPLLLYWHGNRKERVAAQPVLDGPA